MAICAHACNNNNIHNSIAASSNNNNQSNTIAITCSEQNQNWPYKYRIWYNPPKKSSVQYYRCTCKCVGQWIREYITLKATPNRESAFLLWIQTFTSNTTVVCTDASATCTTIGRGDIIESIRTAETSRFPGESNSIHCLIYSTRLYWSRRS